MTGASMRRRSHELAVETRQRIVKLTGLAAICPEDNTWFTQFFTARLPECDLDALKVRLYDEYRVEAPHDPLERPGVHPCVVPGVQRPGRRRCADRRLARLLPELRHEP